MYKSQRASEMPVTNARLPHEDRAVHAAAIAELLADAKPCAAGTAASSGEAARRICAAANWRARRIVQEINAVPTVDVLAELEQDLRSVLISQETRQWVKLTTRALFDECNAEEVAALVASEEAKRTSIETDAARTIAPFLNTCTFMALEEESRMEMVLAYRDTVRWRDRVFCVAVLAAQETATRRGISRQEGLERAETFQRRLVDVGQEVQRELARRSMIGLTAAASRASMHFLHGLRALQHAEGKDRVALELLSLTHLSVMYREAQAALLPALQRDVAAASAQRLAAQHRLATEALLPAAQQDLADTETRLRAMVARAEQDAFQAAYYEFTVGWRDVHSRIAAQPDLATLVSSLELFDRRYIHDAERHARSEILSVATKQQAAALWRMAQLTRLLAEFAKRASRIWLEEAAAYAEMHQWHHTASCTARSISAARLLCLEEERGRLRHRGEEARAALDLRRAAQRHRCLAEAAECVSFIELHEAAARDTLQRYQQLRAERLPLARLAAQEAADRATIELDEGIGCAGLMATKERVMTEAALLCDSAQLMRHERRWREVVAAQEASAAQGLGLAQPLAEERYARATVSREAWLNTHSLERCVTAVAEAAARSAIVAHATGSPLLTLMLAALQEREGLLRRRLATVEAERRTFLVGSVPYHQPFLAACVHDELTHRLDIVAEAELTIRACAYGLGHNTPIQYRTRELEAAQQQLRFFSLGEVCEAAARDIVAAAEPTARRALTAQWWQGCVAARLVLEERVGRERIVDAALSRLAMLSRHCREGAALRQNFEPPVPTGDEWRDDAYGRAVWSEERILRYLRKEEARVAAVAAAAMVAAKSSAEAPAAGSSLGTLLVEMYLARDRLVFEEAAGRHALSRRTASRALERVRAPSLELHSVLVVGPADNGKGSATIDPVVVTGRFAATAGNVAAPQCCALVKEHTAELLGSAELGGTAVALFSTSPVDRRWRLDQRLLLCSPFLLSVCDVSGQTLAEAAFQFSPQHTYDACAVVDLEGSTRARVKVLLHV